MERMSGDLRQPRKQFNHVHGDLSKFENRMQKMKITTPSTACAKGESEEATLFSISGVYPACIFPNSLTISEANWYCPFPFSR
jgi:hypothetical protein